MKEKQKKSRIDMDKRSYDFSQIPELNYATTPEEETQIEQYKQEIIKMGYKSFEVANDFHPFFWELGRKGLICTMTMRIAVIDMTPNLQIIPVFLGMAKRYNGWIQHTINEEVFGGKQARWELVEIEKRNQKITTLENKLKEKNDELVKSRGEVGHLQKEIRSMYSKEELNHLRNELKKEHNKNLAELRSRIRATSKTAAQFMKMLQNPESRIFQAYDLTSEEDIRKYIVWYQLMKREIKDKVLDRIKGAYPDDGYIDAFLEAARKYNEEWQNKFISEDDEVEEDDEETA